MSHTCQHKFIWQSNYGVKFNHCMIIIAHQMHGGRAIFNIHGINIQLLTSILQLSSSSIVIEQYVPLIQNIEVILSKWNNTTSIFTCQTSVTEKSIAIQLTNTIKSLNSCCAHA